ncbi:hypothetical protein D7X33_29390 [Butyricicoccus sp. 1XD8-22]|nr:hypothetical protein D7X33_29390 [Butyricicoccus sp. 1XD8-22]
MKKCQSNGFFDQKMNKKLSKIEKEITEIIPKLNIDKILQPIGIRVNALYNEQENESKEQKLKRVLNMNIDLYTGIKESIEKVNQFNNELIEKIKLTLVGVEK